MDPNKEDIPEDDDLSEEQWDGEDDEEGEDEDGEDDDDQEEDDDDDQDVDDELEDVEVEDVEVEDALDQEAPVLQRDASINQDEIVYESTSATLVDSEPSDIDEDSDAAITESVSPSYQDEPFALPVFKRAEFGGDPAGLLRSGADGLELIDALAGRVSIFGLDTKTIRSAIKKRLDKDLGDALNRFAADEPNDIANLISQCNASSSNAIFDSAAVYPSSELALEAILAASRMRDQGARYRTIAMVGSDHGRTGMCRTASGISELRSGFGPMMAGFDHVPVGDLNAVESAINEQTGCILISPIRLLDAARPVTQDYLEGVRMLCDEHGLLLIVDESQLVFGSTGEALVSSSIADINIDAAILSAGLLGGLDGGLLLTSAETTRSTSQQRSCCPIETTAIEATLYEYLDRELMSSAANRAHEMAVSIAQRVAGYEFVRDVIPMGTSLGIETDLDSEVLAAHCMHFGVYVETAGETAIRMSLPITLEPDDLNTLLDRLSNVFEASEKYQPIPT
ncbi:aminotransferase class III-fold pyridoxal phosphate-dependent enzyme [Rubripirellula amarantea]|nr:aminotransferase class III-fold pyridoxal phosphate-dependent enzyme [Rubripirellula amarantea]